MIGEDVMGPGSEAEQLRRVILAAEPGHRLGHLTNGYERGLQRRTHRFGDGARSLRHRVH